MAVSEAIARQLIYALHDAWNKRDLDALLAVYVDDVSFWANAGGPDGGPLVMNGKAELREFFMVWKNFDCLSVPQNFRFENGVGRCHVEFYIRHPHSGLQHASSYRQIATYRDDRIQRLEQYHDAKAMEAFLALMSSSAAEVTAPRK